MMTDSTAADSEEFLELLRLQGNSDMFTRTQLLDEVGRAGILLTERQLVTFITAGLVPKSFRLSGRGRGMFPRIVSELVSIVALARAQGLPFAPIRELIAVWRDLKQMVTHEQVVDVEAIEAATRRHVHSHAAMFAVPWLVQRAIPTDRMAPLRIRDRTGEERTVRPDDPAVITFVIASSAYESQPSESIAEVTIALRQQPVQRDPNFVLLQVEGAVRPV